MEELKLPKWHNLLGGLTLVLVLLAIWAVFLYAPMEKVMREVQKIFYFHVGTAWNGFFAFFVVFVASIMYLLTKDRKWDTIAGVSAEIGVLFTTLVLITGSIWGSSSWGTWWKWTPRLTSSLVLWFIYLAYVLIRLSITEPQKKATLSAVFGIIGFLDVPIVYFSIKWWGSRLHPGYVTQGGLHPMMVHALIASVFAFTALYFYLLQKGVALERAKQEVERVKETLREKFD